MACRAAGEMASMAALVSSGVMIRPQESMLLPMERHCASPQERRTLVLYGFSETEYQARIGVLSNVFLFPPVAIGIVMKNDVVIFEVLF